MSTFPGGVEPNAKVEILSPERKVSFKKLSAIKPQELLGQVGSRWFFPPSEVRFSKKEHAGYLVTLESGEKLLMAEGTITCGQFGPNLVEDCKDELICFVVMNFSSDSTSRRNFGVEFRGSPDDKKLIARLCKGGSSSEKKFYRYFEMLGFLAKLTKEHPTIQIVPCLEVKRHYKSELYDFAACVKSSYPFMPLIRMGDASQGWNTTPVLPTVLAFCGGYHEVYTRKVIECHKINSSGPWAMPIFRPLDSHTSTRQRFSWSANHIPIFNEIAPHVSEWAAEITQAHDGQEPLPPPPPKVDYRFTNLSNSYGTLCSHHGNEKTNKDPSGSLNQLWDALQKLARNATSEATIKEHLISRIKEVCEPPASTE